MVPSRHCRFWWVLVTRAWHSLLPLPVSSGLLNTVNESSFIQGLPSFTSAATTSKRSVSSNDRKHIRSPYHIIIEPLKCDHLYISPSSFVDLFTNRLEIRRKDIKKIFEPSLNGSTDVLNQQLGLAKENEAKVAKVYSQAVLVNLLLLRATFGTTYDMKGTSSVTRSNFYGPRYSPLPSPEVLRSGL